MLKLRSAKFLTTYYVLFAVTGTGLVSHSSAQGNAKPSPQSAISAPKQLNPTHFPVRPSFRPRVDFWKKVYTQISSKQAYVHDSEDLTVIYGIVEIGNRSRRSKRQLYKKERQRVKTLLRSIRKKIDRPQDWTTEESVLFEKAGRPDKLKLHNMIRQVRIQQGLKDRHREALIRAFNYLDHIVPIFKQYNLPTELAYLPFVESSFNYRAYSKVGAAGMWQFMRSTARRYGLKLNYIVDERRDPITSTHAAAQFLRDNHKRLGTWPLALTAYNHGPGSIERAIRKVGSRDIVSIIAKYRGRRFGFASKNFYATYAATAEIALNPDQYFPDLPPKRAAIPFSTVQLPRALTISHIRKITGLSNTEIKQLNYALRPIAYRNQFYIPKGYNLRLPPQSGERLNEIQTAMQDLKVEKRPVVAGGVHVVSPGESLHLIASIYRVRLSDIISLNQISRPSRIRPGMKITIPGTSDIAPSKTQIAKNPRPKKKTPPQKLAKAESSPSTIAVNTEPTPPMNTPINTNSSQLVATLTPWIQKQTGAESQNKRSRSSDFDERIYNLDITSVKSGSAVVIVESDETLGHLAEWAKTSAQKIRRANGMSYGEPIRYGQELVIPISDEEVANFNVERIQFHQAIEEDLYESYEVQDSREYRVRRGDTIEAITRSKNVPFWLLKKLQPEALRTANLQVGQKLQIPVLQSIDDTQEDLPSNQSDSDTENGE